MRYEVEELDNAENIGCRIGEILKGIGKMAAMEWMACRLVYIIKAKKDIKKTLRAMERSIMNVKSDSENAREPKTKAASFFKITQRISQNLSTINRVKKVKR